MTTRPLGTVLRHLARAAHLHDSARLSDAQLLERYLARRDEHAFEALVRRHGPMVFGVCLRLLGHTQDAEDAFQATFLVLARRAPSVRPAGALGSWLYGVARRTALAARRAGARRQAREVRAGLARPASAAGPDPELRSALDEEIARLPEKYRAPLVLCYLEGRTRQEAAHQLGWPGGTVAGRLARARALLARRLAGRGVGLAECAPAVAVPAALVAGAVRAAGAAPSSAAVAAVVSPRAASLAQGVYRMMRMSKLKSFAVVAFALGVIGLGVGAGARPSDEDAPAPEKPRGAPAKAKEVPAEKAKALLPSGPAPVQVLARLDKGGRLAVRSLTHYYKPVTAFRPDGTPASTYYQVVTEVMTNTYALKDVKVQDTHGRKLDAKAVRKLLKKEVVAVASFRGAPVDPLHLRILKEGTPVLVLPAPTAVAAPPALPAPAVPPPAGAPVPPPAPPAVEVPAVPALPPPAPAPKKP